MKKTTKGAVKTIANTRYINAHWSEGGSGKGTNVPLIIGGAVGVVAIAGIAAFFFMRKS